MTEKSEARVTVLLASYNGAKFVAHQIDSILCQTHQNIQLVLSDDGSTDDTPAILDSYSEKYPDKIVRVRSGKRFGSAQGHFMYLLENCGSGYTMFSDQDDEWLPDKIEKTLALMQKTEREHPNSPVMVHTDLMVTDGELNVTSDSFTRFTKIDGNALSLNRLVIQNVVTGCTMMLNGELTRLAASRALPKECRMHDWWIALIASTFGCAAFLPEATIKYRQHGMNSVGAKNVTDPIYVASRLKKNASRDMINASMRQAGAFADTFSDMLDTKDISMLRAFASCETKGRLARDAAFMRYGIWKCGFVRRVAQLVIG